jgi:hypothetical protein
MRFASIGMFLIASQNSHFCKIAKVARSAKKQKIQKCLSQSL